MKDYLDFEELVALMPPWPWSYEEVFGNRYLWNLQTHHFRVAQGSSHNHQAWEGGYLDHVRETMNIAVRLYYSMDTKRQFPFPLADALLVIFLHDIEKPYKRMFSLEKKEQKREFRDYFIRESRITLTEEQVNALQYIEGEHDYSNTERKMGQMAAFCHCCDILSARVWFDKGRERQW